MELATKVAEKCVRCVIIKYVVINDGDILLEEFKKL